MKHLMGALSVYMHYPFLYDTMYGDSCTIAHLEYVDIMAASFWQEERYDLAREAFGNTRRQRR